MGYWWLVTGTCWLVVAVGVVWIVRWVLTASKYPASSQASSATNGDAGAGAGQKPQAENGHSAPPFDHEGFDDESESSAFCQSVLLKVVRVEGASGEISRILTSRDYYAVLEVSRLAESLEIKKAYRTKQMATHPDKNQGVPGALEASQRVNLAHETLGDEIRRKQYDLRLANEEKYGPRRKGTGPKDLSDLAKAFDEFVQQNMPPPPAGALYPTLDPAAYDVWSDEPHHVFRNACTCGYDHLATRVPNRTSLKARLCLCDKCGIMGRWLSARTNDVWFEMSHSLTDTFSAREKRIRAYRCVGTAVYDVTPWARCNCLLVSPDGQLAPCNTHQVLLRIKGNSSNNKAKVAKQMEKQSAGYGYNQFKGGGNDSHKHRNQKKRKK